MRTASDTATFVSRAGPDMAPIIAFDLTAGHSAKVTFYPWKDPPALKARTINRVRPS
jgi:hypothetical protein